MDSWEKGLRRYLEQEKLAKLGKIKIGLAGAGGLGSNCVAHLARSGFKDFLLVDFDLVEESNLNRQFYFSRQVGQYKVDALRDNLLAINPALQVLTLKSKICADNVEKIFTYCDVVVEAVDKAESKQIIVEKFWKGDKLLVAASGVCGWGNSDRIKVKKVKKNFYVIGDLLSEVGRENPPLAPLVNVAAAKQADVILSYFLQEEKDE